RQAGGADHADRILGTTAHQSRRGRRTLARPGRVKSSQPTMSKLIFGCGYLGGRVARLWRRSGHEVFVVTRSKDRARALSAEGYRAIVADVLRPETLVELPTVDTVLY